MTMYSPRFCYANYITESLITVSTNTAVKLRLIDRNAERRWISTSGDETGTLTFTVTSEIDTICFLNTNANEFTITYDAGTEFDPVINQDASSQETISINDADNNYLVDNSTNYVVSAGVATRRYNDYYFKFEDVTPGTSVVITVTSTTDDLALRVGQVFIGKEILELASSGSMPVGANTKQYLKEMSDGTTNKVYVRRTNNYDLTLNNVSAQERANLEIMYDINKRESIFFIARPAIGATYFDGLADHVEWVNEFSFNNYYNDIENNGFTGKMSLRSSSGIK